MRAKHTAAISASLLFILGSACFFISVVAPLFKRKREGKTLPIEIELSTLVSVLSYCASSFFGLKNTLKQSESQNKSGTVLAALTSGVGSMTLMIEGAYRFIHSPSNYQPKIYFLGCLSFLISGGYFFQAAIKGYNQSSEKPKNVTSLVPSLFLFLAATGSGLFAADGFARNDSAQIAIKVFDCSTGCAYCLANLILFAQSICCNENDNVSTDEVLSASENASPLFLAEPNEQNRVASSEAPLVISSI